MSDPQPKPENKNPIRVLIVEDHPVVRRGIRNIIEHEEDLEVCGEAEDVQQAVQMVETTRPHVALVDLSLKDSDGMNVIHHIRRAWVGLKTIVVSGYEPLLYSPEAMLAGASGYISKDEGVDHIPRAIRCVCGGGTYFTPNVEMRTGWFG